MVSNHDEQLVVVQRLTSLESTSKHHEESIRSHSESLSELAADLHKLIAEVGKVKYALYIVAGCIAANAPALSSKLNDILSFLK